jgi:uroporphyrinogen-III synthase
MKTVCSTKKLSPKGKAYLECHEINVVDYDAIDIRFLDFAVPHDGFDYLIFTSQNAVKGYLQQLAKTSATSMPEPLPCFCVGPKTRAMLEKNGYPVLKAAKNAEALGQYLAATHKNDSFLFLCGNRRREELPNLLKKNGIALKEVVVYETRGIPKKLPVAFDGVLFFSPTGVESFFSVNSPQGIAFCIGATTAAAARRFTKEVVVSELATTEKLLEVTVAKLYEPGIASH